ncbi:hypothetical protein GS682_32990 [Nostoc sp. B(2019)]|nr:hypothetical protein [Nostoc sp. B(2019)]
MSDIESLKRQISFRKFAFVVASVINIGCAEIGIYQFGLMNNSSAKYNSWLYSFTFIGSLMSSVSFYELVCCTSQLKKLEQEKARNEELKDIMNSWWEKNPIHQREEQ